MGRDCDGYVRSRMYASMNTQQYAKRLAYTHVRTHASTHARGGCVRARVRAYASTRARAHACTTNMVRAHVKTRTQTTLYEGARFTTGTAPNYCKDGAAS